jgi:hypothetical protein
MKRTQIQLADPVYDTLRQRAYETRTSIAGVVREALSAYLLPRPKPAGQRKPRRPSFIACCRTAQGSLKPVSERHDEALARAFGH